MYVLRANLRTACIHAAQRCNNRLNTTDTDMEKVLPSCDIITEVRVKHSMVMSFIQIEGCWNFNWNSPFANIVYKFFIKVTQATVNQSEITHIYNTKSHARQGLIKS